MQFKLKDEVVWVSQSYGVRSLKTGKIVVVIPTYKTPDCALLREDFPDCSTDAMKNPGFGRDHESYIIRVPSRTKAKDKLYWPRVSALRLVE